MSESYIIAKAKTRLAAANYRCIWSVDGPNESAITAWSNGRRVLILHDSREDGFELYKPASPSNDVEKTLKGAGI